MAIFWAIMTIMAILSIMAIMARHIMAINIVVYEYQANITSKTNNLQKKSSEYRYYQKIMVKAINSGTNLELWID